MQIQSEIPKAAGVMLAGHGDSCSNTGVVTNVSIEFAYDDFDVASAQFFMVGEKLKFPPGSKLTHVIFDPEDGSCDFAALAEW